MSRHLFPVLASLFILALLRRAEGSRECYSGCNFRPCNNVTAFDLRTTYDFYAFTGGICLKSGAKAGLLTQSGQALIVRKVPTPPYIAFMQISTFHPWELRAPFKWDFFRFAKVYYPVFNANGPPEYKWSGKSGVARAPWRENQQRFLHHKCMVLPVRRYKLEGDDDDDDDIVSKSGRDCVAFYVTSQ
eukprot:IDg12343t1